jgi:hypothetical protein
MKINRYDIKVWYSLKRHLYHYTIYSQLDLEWQNKDSSYFYDRGTETGSSGRYNVKKITLHYISLSQGFFPSILSLFFWKIIKNSQTCIKRSPIYRTKTWQDKKKPRWPFNTGDCFIEVTTWAGLTVNLFID